MMTWIFKNIHLFSLFLSALILNAHMIIPHDHHQADSDLCQEKSYPVSDNRTNHHSTFPPHCHAFNDMTSEKAITCVIIKYFQSKDLAPCCLSDSYLFKTQFCGIRITHHIYKPIVQTILNLSSLRAPPPIC
jgi:hypothetical protein